MKTIIYGTSMVMGLLLFFSCNMQKGKKDLSSKTVFTGRDGEIQLVVLDPGHFHANLLQKFPQKQVNDTVFVYAPEGNELNQYLVSIEGYNKRSDNPTKWNEIVYSSADYLQKMIEEKKGNVVIIAGNNLKKTEYISKTVNAGYNVLSDKPMAINTENFELLKSAFDSARTQKVLLYDVMTERYEILNTLTRELVNSKEFFGELQDGTPDNPSVVMENVHHFYKLVSGNVLVRPAWFYDVEQQGEGMVDVGTHLVDLINWQCFPDSIIDYRSDVKITSASHWPTKLSLSDFTRSTKLDTFPNYLTKYVKNSLLEVYSNGRINYQVNGKNISITALWNYEAPKGGGDTYSALIKGDKASIRIVQNKEENYIKQLYVEKDKSTDEKEFESVITKTVGELQKSYPYISVKRVSANKYQIVVPVESRKGHEDYFGYVAQKYFGYLVNQNMPEWEISNIIAKYYITTKGLEIAKNPRP